MGGSRAQRDRVWAEVGAEGGEALPGEGAGRAARIGALGSEVAEDRVDHLTISYPFTWHTLRTSQLRPRHTV